MLRLRTVFSLVLATLMTPLMLLGASPAMAAEAPPGTPGPFKIISQADQNFCLDYGTRGNLVYLGLCNPNDAGQRWGWFNHGWLINLSNGGCVSSNGLYAIVLACVPDAAHYWRHQNYAIVNEQTGVCLRIESLGVVASPIIPVACANDRRQGWYVNYW